MTASTGQSFGRSSGGPMDQTVAQSGGANTMLNFAVKGLNCAGCAGRAERALAAVPGVSAARVNLATSEAQVDLAEAISATALRDALQAAGYPAADTQICLEVNGMSCGSCVGRVERALAAVPGVLEASVNLATGQAWVRVLAGAAVREDLLSAVSATGFAPTVVGENATVETEAQAEAQRRKAETQLRNRVILSGVLTLPLFVVEMGGHAFPPLHHWLVGLVGHHTLQVFQVVLATLVLAGPGRVFFAKGVPALLRGAPDMNALVAAGTSAAWLYSTFAVIAPGLFPAGTAQLYYEAAAVVCTLVLLGRWLEGRAKGQTGAAIRALVALTPDVAERVLPDGQVVEIDLQDVAPGQILRLRPGARIPVDGAVVAGQGAVDESLMTGEAMPVAKSDGAPLIAGTVNGTAVLDMRVEAVGRDTTLSRIIRMVSEAQGAKLPVQALVDRITLWFVPAVMAFAALTALVWLIFGPQPSLPYAVVTGVCVLIIACPCAMGLATPTSVMVALGRAAELGVLFRRGDALQSLGDVDVLVFDKTGTLTEGRPALHHRHVRDGFDPDWVLTQVAAIEAQSEHPVATAFVSAVDAPLPEVSAVEAITGLGVRGRVGDKALLVGSARLMQQEGFSLDAFTAKSRAWADQGESVVFAAFDDAVVGAFSITDPVKAEAADVISQLRAAGVTPVMLTGDSAATAQSVAAVLGIEDVQSECLPEDKHSRVTALKERGRRVGFVGDGINDAPALAAADVSIAIGTGADVAIETADIVLSGHDLRAVTRAHGVSRAAMRNIRQNLFWAFGYNVLLIPVAAGALFPLGGPLLSPSLGGAAMALSSVFVVSNALRLRGFTPTFSGVSTRNQQERE